MVKKELTFVLFGGTGDLTKRKLVPAVANLIHQGDLSKGSVIVGISRKQFDDEQYRAFLLKGAVTEDQINHIRKARIKYFQGDFSKKSGMNGLNKFLGKIESKNGNNRLFYLSTSFEYFPKIVDVLKKQKLDKNKGGFTRIIFEKPFGDDLNSSNKLDKEIHDVFKEKDIYRIDHYLAKDTVQNLQVLKFTNPILSSTLDREHVEYIEIRVDEKLGAGNRLEYYQKTGAIKDMIQNHLLQVLALVLMRKPKDYSAKSIHDEKVRILKNIRVLSYKEHLLGQYNSFQDELKSKRLKNNDTDTFARISLNCKTPEWNGVRLVLRTGKKLPEKVGKIRINLKSLTDETKKTFQGAENNRIRIDIYPKQDVRIYMNSRNSLCYNCASPAKFEFCKESHFGPNTINEYSVLIDEALKGDKTLFTRSDEIKASWEIVEKINKMKKKIKFVKYKDDTDPDPEKIN